MHLVKYLLIYFLFCLSNLSANNNNNNNDFNPYEVLGLTRTASDKDIRQAYKKLAKHWHPDKNSEPNAHEQFTKINAAYEVNISNQ
jgi:DnaJ-class molecular chaperone